MTRTHGREYLAIPGPSVMPDAVLNAMHRPAPNIYAGELVEMAYSLVPDLRSVARTAQHVAVYIGNGHAAWEAALANTVAPGQAVLVPATGRFGHGWADQAQGLGIQTDIIDFGKSAPMDLNRVEDALRADTAHRLKAVLVTHVDTSTSVLNNVQGVRAVLDAVGHPALLMADCIASLGCDRFEMDAWGVDVMVAASQKGLMTPPGLGLVFFSDKAVAVRAKMPVVSRYWDWTPRANPTQFHMFSGGTAPTHHIYGLRAALDMMMAEGMEAIWDRHDRLARAIWAAVAAWGQGGSLRCNIEDPALRSRAVTALRMNAPDATRLREWTEAEAGLTLGIGLGMAEPGSPESHGFFRIGHMGHLNPHMVLGMLGSIEAGFVALNIDHGPGALSAAARVIAA
jgi:alanine-glyoxylate transaminase/serine-glyoxylate transaminase/serine-pyruvate transaminase